MGSYEWMELQSLTSEIALSRSRLAAARKTRDVGRIRALEEEITSAEARRERLLAHITTNLVGSPEPAAAAKGGKAAEAAPEPAPPAKAAKGAEAPEPAPSEQPPPEAPPPEPRSARSARNAEAAETPAPVEEDPAPVEAAAPAAEATPAEVEADGAAEANIVVEAAAEAAPEVAGAAVIDEPPAPETDRKQRPADAVETAAANDAASPARTAKAAAAEGGLNVWDQLTPSDIERAKQDLVTRRAEMLARHAEELRGLEADQVQLETLEQAIATFLQKFTGAPGGAGVVKLEEQRELRQQGAG